MGTETSKATQDIGEFIRMVLEDAGMYPSRELAAEEARGIDIALANTVVRLTDRAKMGLLMLAWAWADAGETGKLTPSAPPYDAKSHSRTKRAVLALYGVGQK